MKWEWIYLLIATIPLMFRFFIVLKGVKGPSGKFIPRALVNVVKFSLALSIPVVSMISLRNGKPDYMLYIIIVLTSITTMMTFTWDLHVDWGLL